MVVTRPANDDFANSFDLAQITTGNNANGSREPGEPPSHNPDGASAGQSVWWHWTAPSDGWVVLSTEGSGFDTVVAIYTGNTVDNLLLISWNNDPPYRMQCATLFSSRRHRPVFADAGTTYQSAVDGISSPYQSGGIQLNVRYDVPPAVAITSPAEGAVFRAVADIPVHVTAQDAEGAVVQVQLTTARAPSSVPPRTSIIHSIRSVGELHADGHSDG